MSDYFQPYGLNRPSSPAHEEQVEVQRDGSAIVILYTGSTTMTPSRVEISIRRLDDTVVYCDDLRTHILTERVANLDRHTLKLPPGTLPAMPCLWSICIDGLPPRTLVSGRNHR